MKLKELNSKKIKKNTPCKTLFKLERRLNYKSLIIFTAISVFFIALTLALYPIMKERLSEAPSGMLGLQSIGSFFVMQVGQNWIMLGLILGSFLGYQLLAGNFRTNSNTLLYSQNLSRKQILSVKLSRLVINILIFNVICAVAGFIGISIIEFGEVNILNYLLYTFLITLMCLQIGIFMFGLTAIFLKRIAPFFSFALPILLLIFSSLALITEEVEFIKYISPSSIIEFSGTTNILTAGLGSINILSLVIWTVIPVVILVYGVMNFNKKDLV